MLLNGSGRVTHGYIIRCRGGMPDARIANSYIIPAYGIVLPERVDANSGIFFPGCIGVQGTRRPVRNYFRRWYYFGERLPTAGIIRTQRRGVKQCFIPDSRISPADRIRIQCVHTVSGILAPGCIVSHRVYTKCRIFEYPVVLLSNAKLPTAVLHRRLCLVKGTMTQAGIIRPGGIVFQRFAHSGIGGSGGDGTQSMPAYTCIECAGGIREEGFHAGCRVVRSGLHWKKRRYPTAEFFRACGIGDSARECIRGSHH